jgi:hypothetical protein
MAPLNPEQVKKIVSVKNILERAQHFTDVPWQAVAAVWYRESFSIASPITPGGPFQFDPRPPVLILGDWLVVYAGLNPDSKSDSIIMHNLCTGGVNDFACAAIFAACWLCHQCRYSLKIDHSDVAIKDAFYGYNGRAWGPHPESSPYVYNNFDLLHTNMTIRGSIPDPHSKTGRRFISMIDRRPGAFTVYRQLIDEKV